MFFCCQSNFGPSLGHSLSKPASCETPLRSGPRHCGQSLACETTVMERLIASSATESKLEAIFFMVVSSVLPGQGLWSSQPPVFSARRILPRERNCDPPAIARQFRVDL